MEINRTLFNRLNLYFGLKIAESRAILCPPAATIAPCTCSSYLWGTGVELDCSNQGLSDSQLATKLNAFLPTTISPLLSLNAHGNSLTIVPVLLPKFASLWIIDLSIISNIPFGLFAVQSHKVDPFRCVQQS